MFYFWNLTPTQSEVWVYQIKLKKVTVQEEMCSIIGDIISTDFKFYCFIFSSLSFKMIRNNENDIKIPLERQRTGSLNA